jgi:septal ring factor EnvC (AmiA/AmiB activator)
MHRFAPALFAAPLLLAASAPVPVQSNPLDDSARAARAEQASAEAEAARLEKVADSAQGQAARLHAQQAAAAQGIEAAEARITAADAELRLLSATLASRRADLQRQLPIASLLAGLAMMGRRPPLLAIASEGSTDDFVKVRVLLDSTLPVIRQRTAALSGELAEGQKLELAAVAARQELIHSRANLVGKRQQFASLEQRAIQAATAAGGQALGAGDVALAAGEQAEKLQEAERGARSAWALASEVEAIDPAPPRPVSAEGGSRTPPLRYELPASAPVTDGLGEVNLSGVQSRGVTLATGRGTPVTAPATGVIRFAGPYGTHDGVIIIDHGNGWKSLLVNVASSLKVGDRVAMGDPIGLALGPISVELSQNGHRVSAALIAGSSESLSNKGKGG